MQNKNILKELSSGKSGKTTGGRKLAINIPGLDALKKSLAKTSTKQAVDIALFTVGIYIMYRFGKSVAQTLDNQMPTEKSMMDMMK